MSKAAKNYTKEELDSLYQMIKVSNEALLEQDPEVAFFSILAGMESGEVYTAIQVRGHENRLVSAFKYFFLETNDGRAILRKILGDTLLSSDSIVLGLLFAKSKNIETTEEYLDRILEIEEGMTSFTQLKRGEKFLPPQIIEEINKQSKRMNL